MKTNSNDFEKTAEFAFESSLSLDYLPAIFQNADLDSYQNMQLSANPFTQGPFASSENKTMSSYQPDSFILNESMFKEAMEIAKKKGIKELINSFSSLKSDSDDFLLKAPIKKSLKNLTFKSRTHNFGKRQETSSGAGIYDQNFNN